MRRTSPFSPVRRQPDPEPKPPPSRPAILRRLGGLYARFRDAFLLGAGVLLALLVMLAYDATKPPPQRLTQRDIDVAVARTLESATPRPSYASQAYEVIRPSLVRIYAPAASPEAEPEAAGTGVVIDASGIILTSLHVVGNAEVVRTVFSDETESEALVVARQPANDLAVLSARVIPDDLVPATLASSQALSVGDEVFVAGHPFGIANSLSAGIVSGLGRTFRSPRTGETLTNLIQFDAAANPGNSGGPLVNRDGEVVGIVAALLNPTGQEVFVGIGFAVPIEIAAQAAGSPPD